MSINFGGICSCMEKDNFNANVDFVRGQADMIVLSALSDSDKYGLEILSAIQERSQGMYSLKQATLYSSLKRLEKNGYVHSYDGDISNGAKRVYYGLTEMGREHLDNDKSYWEFCNFLMSNLISDNKFDPQNEDKPFDPAEFRPLTRRTRGEKETKDQDQEQDKEVVVKYVYLKSDEIPEGADIVYVSPENVEQIQKTSTVVTEDSSDNDNNAEQQLEEIDLQATGDENNQMTTLSDNADEYQPSFILVDDDNTDVENSQSSVDNEELSDSPIADSAQQKVETVENQLAKEPTKEIAQNSHDFILVNDDNDAKVDDQIWISMQTTPSDEILDVVEIEKLTKEITESQEISTAKYEAITTDNAEDTIEDSAVASEENAVDNRQSQDGFEDNIVVEEQADIEENQADFADVEESTNEIDSVDEQEEIAEEADINDDNSAASDSFANRPLRNYTQDSSASFASIFSNYSRENDVNYVDSFTELFDVEDEEDLPEQELSADIEYLTMKEMVNKYHSKGITIKPYDKRNTMEYYVNRYYFSNKIHFHASLIIFAILAVELFVSHFICNRGDNKISNAWLLSILLIALYPAIRGVMYIIDPTRKSLANYNPKTSILISLLPVITLPIVFALMGFVEFGANINDYMSMERTIILPSVLLFNVPLYSIVYTLLYRTYNYHVN